MIVLLKIYKKTILKAEYTKEATGAKPYAIYENENLHVLTEDELLSIFPNVGKIFISDTYSPPEKPIFRFFEVYESPTFDESIENSSRYTLGKEVTDIKYYEVIDLDESIAEEKTEIENKLRKGINSPFILSEYIILRTSDDYLIGPIKMEFSEGLYYCREQEFIPYFQQEIDITIIFDEFQNNERLFFLNELNQDSIIGWIDIATEERIISDALKQLKDNSDLAELSRKMIARLKEMYKSNNSKIPHLQERLRHAIQIMESHTLNGEEISYFNELILDLDVTKKLVENRVNHLFEDEYEQFLKKHDELVKDNNIQEQKLKTLSANYSEKLKNLKNSEKQYTELEDALQQKIKQLKDSFTSVYAEQLASSNLPDISSQRFIDSVRSGFAHYQSISGKTISNLDDFFNLLNENLKDFRGNDERGTLAATVVSAVILGEPLIIFGESSFELAKCITSTIACEQIVTVIPEVETFSLNELDQHITHFTSLDLVKALIIHNPHLTAALYSLPTYLKQNKWMEQSNMPNLTIISIDSLDEALPFIERMPYIPLIKSTDFLTCFNRRKVKSIQFGQLELRLIDEHAIEQNQVAIRRNFREWIEDNKDLESKIPYPLDDWLNQLNEFITEEKLFEWCFSIFQKSIKIIEKEKVGV